MAPRKKVDTNTITFGGEAAVVGTHVAPTVDIPLQQGQTQEDFHIVTLPGVGSLDLWVDGHRQYSYKRGVALRPTAEDVARITPFL